MVTRLLLLLVALCLPTSASSQGWPELFDPFVVRTLDLTLDPGDWDTIRFDQTFGIEVPAQLSMGGEPPILVAIRRKSGDALPSEADPRKVSLKIDINELVPGQTWHDLRKISLENGDDVNVVTEGFSWYMHRLAMAPEGYPYQPGLAAWWRVNVNGSFVGLYLSVEQIDKQFLKNRGLWASGSTWLYKVDGSTSWELREGDTHSASYTTLCYTPFPEQTCPPPAPGPFAAEVGSLTSMQGMLTLGAVNAFCINSDHLFSKGKNFFVVDFADAPRMYVPWDLDSNTSRFLVDPSIHDRGNSDYEPYIIDNPTFRAMYDGIVRDLFTGPLSPPVLTGALDQFEALLAPHLAADPYTQIDDIGDLFDEYRAWIGDRQVNVLDQLPDLVVGIPDGDGSAGAALALSPNPVRDRTRIRFALPAAGQALLTAHDVRGRRVADVAEGTFPAGEASLSWVPRDDRGRRLAGGVYFLRLRTAGAVETRRLLVLP